MVPYGEDNQFQGAVYHAFHDQAPEYMSNILQEKPNARTLHSTVSSQLASRHQIQMIW